MQSPLQRLYKTKIMFAAFVATIAGAAGMVAAGWPDWRTITALICGALFTVGVVLIGFQYVGNEDAAEENKRQLREAVSEEAPSIQRAVVNAMALAPKSILDVTASDVVDRVVENSLAKQLGDQELAADVYADLKAQVLSSKERWRNLRISASLASWKPSELAPKPMFVATFRYDYHVTKPARVMRFASVADRNEYRELQRDPSFTEVWYVGSQSGLDGASPDAFQLVEVTVNGQLRKSRRTTRLGAQYYSVDLGPEVDAGGDVAISFTYRGLVLQHGHLLYIDLAKPTKGLTVNLAYGNAGISYVNFTDFIAAAKRPAISQAQATDPNPSVSLTFDGWVMPRGGMTFTWELDDESAVTPSEP